jgi:hypothetical protein
MWEECDNSVDGGSNIIRNNTSHSPHNMSQYPSTINLQRRRSENLQVAKQYVQRSVLFYVLFVSVKIATFSGYISGE